jgi:hypothetical protein
VLWALAEYQKLGKERLTDGFQFKDLFWIVWFLLSILKNGLRHIFYEC